MGIRMQLAVLLWASALAGRAFAGTDPVASVGGRDIAEGDLEAAVQETMSSSGYYHRLSAEKKLELQREKLQDLIRKEWNVLAAYDLGWKPSFEEGERRRAAFEERVGTEAYSRALAARGWTRERHARAIAETLLGDEAYRCLILDPARVTTSEARAVYRADPGKWRVPESVHVFHILLAVPKAAEGSLRAARRKEAEDVIAKLRAGADFGALAFTSSDDPYRVKGGDLGWVHRGRLADPVERAAWRLKVGELSEPIEGEDGWHVVLVRGRRESRVMGFDEVAPALLKQMEQERVREREKAVYQELGLLYTPQIHASELLPKGAP